MGSIRASTTELQAAVERVKASELAREGEGAGEWVESKLWQRIFFILAACLVVFSLAWPFVDHALNNDHYIYLARSFANGSLAVDNLPPVYRDFIYWEGHKYLPFGPLPGLILVPFLPLIDAGLYLVWVCYIFTALNLWVFGKILTLAGLGDARLKWALLFFFGGTSYFGVNLVGISTYFAHIVTVTFVLLAMWEMLGARRLPLVGLYLGLAGMARLTSLFTLPFFLWLAWSRHQALDASPTPDPRPPTPSHASRFTAHVLRPLALLALGLAGPLALLGLYNYLRFGSPLESGYALAQLYEPVLAEARDAGLFSLAHVPKNLFMMLLQGPVPIGGADTPVFQFPYIEPSAWGMSIFLTSPALVYIFRSGLKTRLAQACWLGALAALLPIITYYGIGWVQFGYRYALDFMPFLALLAALGWRAPMSNLARSLVVASVVVTFWGSLFLTIWI